MENNLEFIINNIIKVSKTNFSESLQDSELIRISGIKKGIFKNEEIQILIERTPVDENNTAYVTAINNSKSKSEIIYKEILFDILKRTNLLDKKLEMKLDIILNNRTLRFEDGKLIID